MKYLRSQILSLLIATFLFNISLANESEIILTDRSDTSYIQHSQSTEELAQIAILEREIRDLTGRIEILEHSIEQLKQQLPNNTQISQLPNRSDKIDGIESGNSINSNISETSGAKNFVVSKEIEQREYDLALATLKDEKYDEAERLFYDFASKYPKSDLLSNAYFWYSESFYRRNDFDKAAINYLKHYQKFSTTSKAPDSLLKLALSLGSMQKNKEACVILKKLDDEYQKRSSSSKKRSYDAKIKFGCK